MKFINSYIEESRKILEIIDKRILIKFIKEIANLRNRKGRIFFLGMVGSDGNCSHEVNDIRKLCEIEKRQINFEQKFSPYLTLFSLHLWKMSKRIL